MIDDDVLATPGATSGKFPSWASFHKDAIDKHSVPAENKRCPSKVQRSDAVSFLFSKVFINYSSCDAYTRIEAILDSDSIEKMSLLKV